jgi:hypothetical protein
MVRPVLWSGVKAVGREAIRTGGNIMTDIGTNTSPDVRPGNVVASIVGEYARNLKQKTCEKGRRKRAASKSRKTQTKRGKPPTKEDKLTKRDVFA